MVSSSPSLNIFVAFSVPTIQGIPNSRETIAAWHVLLPWSVTIAEAIFIIGTQSGSVIFVTRISPLRKSFSLDAENIFLTFPDATLFPTAIPLRTGCVDLLSLSLYSL